jgi:uncharacterized protein (TIGR02145 family)
MKLFSSTHLIRLTFIGLPLMIAVSCKKNDSAPPTAPAVTTTALTNITTSSATAGGTILTNGNAAITQSGIVWSKTNATPILTDSVIAGTTSSGSFTTNLTGLDFNTAYYIRAYATNSVGTGYGDVITLNTVNDTLKVRFTYNGQSVTYGIIVSTTTGKKWLDRNLGSNHRADSINDYNAYGDFFQWGRPADGHQLMNWTSSTIGVPVNGTTTTLATTDNPGHSNFILRNPAPAPPDWRSDNNSNRWVTIPQGPCPAGWHVPSIDEWMAEVSTTKGGTATVGGMTDRNSAYNMLKLTLAGYRNHDGTFGQTGTNSHYWSSTDFIAQSGSTQARDFEVASSQVQQWTEFKARGLCVRCLKN